MTKNQRIEMTSSSSVNYNLNRLLFTMSIIVYTLLSAVSFVDSQRSTESPCPNFFNYQYNAETGEYTGLVQVPSPPLGSTLHLTVKLTLNARLPSVSDDFYNLLIDEKESPLTYSVSSSMAELRWSSGIIRSPRSNDQANHQSTASSI